MNCSSKLNGFFVTSYYGLSVFVGKNNLGVLIGLHDGLITTSHKSRSHGVEIDNIIGDDRVYVHSLRMKSFSVLRSDVHQESRIG